MTDNQQLDTFPTADEVLALALKAKGEYDPTAPQSAEVTLPPMPERFQTIEGIQKAFEEDLELFYKDTKKYLLDGIKHVIDSAKTYGHIEKTIDNKEQMRKGYYSKGYNFENKMVMAVNDGYEHGFYHRHTNGCNRHVTSFNAYNAFGSTPVYVRLAKELNDKGYRVTIKGDYLSVEYY